MTNVLKNLNINPDLLYAYAQVFDGMQFSKSELRCRIVWGETDQGYRTDSLNIEVFGVPTDEAEYKRATGRSTADIVFSGFRYKERGPAPGSVVEEDDNTTVERLIRDALINEFARANGKVIRLREILKGAGVTDDVIFDMLQNAKPSSADGWEGWDES